jgi:hypothetical protein
MLQSIDQALQVVAQALQDTPVAQWISTSPNGFPAIETIHVICITLVVGTISILDMRLLYANSKGRSVRAVSQDILPFTWGAFALAVISGGLLFTSKATEYVENWPFRLKMILMACAGVNMVIFHFTTYRTVEAWDMGQPPRAARVSAALSLTFWALVIISGRWIGFTVR